MTDTNTTLVTIELLLHNGRELFFALELPRDEILESDDAVTYVVNSEPGIREEHIVKRADVAYVHRREGEATRSPYRTLGRSEMVPQRREADYADVSGGTGQ